MRKLNFYLRMGLVSLWAMIVTLIVFVTSVIFWGRTFNSVLYSRLLCWVSMPLLGVKLIVKGKENLPKEPSFILINHQSNLDAFFLGSIFPRNTVIIAKKEMLKVPLFGLILLSSRNILFDRDDSASAKKVIKKSVTGIQKDKNNIWIFPEGTRSLGQGLGEFKLGAFVMAIAAQAPIICIINQPMEHVLDIKNKTASGGRHHVTILPPIATAGLKLRDAERIAHEIEAIFKKEIINFPT